MDLIDRLRVLAAQIPKQSENHSPQQNKGGFITINKPSVINHITEHISSAIGFEEIMYTCFEQDDPQVITSPEYQSISSQLASFATALPRESRLELEEIIGGYASIFQKEPFTSDF